MQRWQRRHGPSIPPATSPRCAVAISLTSFAAAAGVGVFVFGLGFLVRFI